MWNFNIFMAAELEHSEIDYHYYHTVSADSR